MKMMRGYSIVDQNGDTAIIEQVFWNQLKIRYPDKKTARVPKIEVMLLAESIAETIKAGNSIDGLSFEWQSTLIDLANKFGYSYQRIPTKIFYRIKRQLTNAGLALETETEAFNSKETFRLSIAPITDNYPSESEGDSKIQELDLADSWPSLLGLPSDKQLYFLRSLTEAPPILCRLDMRGVTGNEWLQSFWESLTAWAYRSAQKFVRNAESSQAEVRVKSPRYLHSFFEPSPLDQENENPGMAGNHTLTLVTITRDNDIPNGYQRLKAFWPGPVFEFDPYPDNDNETDFSELINYLFKIVGQDISPDAELSPLESLRHVRDLCQKLLFNALHEAADIFSKREASAFKGSNESSIALALKLITFKWLGSSKQIQFEYTPEADENTRQRIDVYLENKGRFEIETMLGSGPFETFMHQKVFSRLSKKDIFFLVVPNECLLWAAPFLADLANQLGENGNVIFPGLNGSFCKITGKNLEIGLISVEEDEIYSKVRTSEKPKNLTDFYTLDNVAGYHHAKDMVEEIVFLEQHKGFNGLISRASGVLFFGPPGCGKSLMAKAIAGKLEHQHRIVGPSDLRGAFIGWGQILIREQFDWLMESDQRVLIIDELDAIARSRATLEMHSDEKACVNELLVQLDRASLAGRLVIATTNFIEDLDPAVIRSGRFGRFIPIAMPTFEETIEILSYYLNRLQKHNENLEIPDSESIKNRLKKLYQTRMKEQRFLTGADLEESINRCALRLMKKALEHKAPGSSYIGPQKITSSDIEEMLHEIPCSVNAEVAGNFMKDVEKFCSYSDQVSIKEKFKPES